MESVEVEMVEALMLAPSFVFFARGVAEQLRSAKVEDVEAIGAASYLDKQLLVPIQNSQDTIFNFHL